AGFPARPPLPSSAAPSKNEASEMKRIHDSAHRRRHLAVAALAVAGALVASMLTIAPARAADASLLISEYVEGSGTTKAVELYNPAEGARSLDGWTLVVYFNGKSTAGTTIALSGS